MKRELIEKVVGAAAARNIIDLKDCSLTQAERQQEIVEMVHEEIEESNKKCIEELVDEFGRYLLSIPTMRVLEDCSEDYRPVTVEEASEFAHGEFMDLVGQIEDILKE